MLWLCKHTLNGSARPFCVHYQQRIINPNLYNRTCPCAYASLCGFLIGGEIWQVRSLPRPLRLLSDWGRWYDLLSPDKGQNATVPPLQVTQKEKKDNSTQFLVFFSDVYYKKRWINPWILSCTVWSGMSIKWFSFERRRREEMIYHTKGGTNGNCCMMLLDPRELTNSRLWTFATIEWRFFISLSFLSLLFFFRLVTILYYLNDVDEGGQTAFVIADNSTLNETVR